MIKWCKGKNRAYAHITAAMWRLLLVVAIAQLAHATCPTGYDLVKDGQCRGYQDRRTIYFNDAPRIAQETCDKVQGQPIIIHNEEQQAYWKNRAPQTNEGFAILGIVCNITSKRYQWADGSAIDFKPTGLYNEALNNDCSTEYGWDIHPDGYWSYGGSGAMVTATFFCTVQLELPAPGADGCDNFADDSEDGVCYQVGAASEDWKTAQMTCKKFGANLASIHNKQENDFVRRLAVSKGVVNGLVLGATAQEDGSFAWIDGTTMDYENYYPGFPKKNFGDCIAMDTSAAAGQWMNVDCQSKFPVACVRSQGESVEPTCSGEDYDEYTVITSPGYPFSSYTPCDYFFTAPAGKHVQVEIISLEANKCCDSLILYDGYLGGAVIANLSGIYANATYATTTSNIMRVSWQPNGGVNVKGVVMIYRSI